MLTTVHSQSELKQQYADFKAQLEKVDIYPQSQSNNTL